MAGSLLHITDNDTGRFTMDTIENLGDAAEALRDCHQIIAYLVTVAPEGSLREACRRARTPMPDCDPALEDPHA